MLTFDRYVAAATLDEAFDALHDIAGARLVAGATDLLPWAREGRAGDVHLPALVDIGSIPQLTAVSLDRGILSIGAAVPIAACERHPLLLRHAGLLARCAAWFADDQIREQATMGGNVVNASPAGDTLPALLAMNARLALACRDRSGIRERLVPLAEFILGPGKTVLEPGEVLTRIDCDAVAGYGGAFEKVGHRRSLVISTACLAVLARLAPGSGVLEDVRIAVGAVGPVPERLDDVEASLRGARPTPALLRSAAELAAGRVRSRSRQEYRREVLVNFVERGLAAALAQCGLDVERLPKEPTHA